MKEYGIIKQNVEQIIGQQVKSNKPKEIKIER